jgi:hypothetical protein
MNETILLYNFEGTKIGQAIEEILQSLHVRCIHVQPNELQHPLGYLLQMDGFIPETKEVTPSEQEMMVIHDFSDKQIRLLLDVFKEAGIPFIPLKAVVTQNNVHWSFSYLLEHVKEECEMMTRKNA